MRWIAAWCCLPDDFCLELNNNFSEHLLVLLATADKSPRERECSTPNKCAGVINPSMQLRKSTNSSRPSKGGSWPWSKNIRNSRSFE